MSKIDRQQTGLAGELFVAAELLKRGLQASITFGNAKAIDILACNSETGRTFTVQVKALRRKNWFLINRESINPKHIYVFVLLNEPGISVEYYIVPGHVLKEHPERFGRGFAADRMPGIEPKDLVREGFRDRWNVFLDA
jgi:hypothetical protein